MWLAMNMRMVCVGCLCNLCVSVCMSTVSDDLLVSSAIVRSGGLFWLKPVVMV